MEPGTPVSQDDHSRYERAVAALGRAQRFGIHPSLSGIRALTEVLGRPQDAYRVVQVTGTNGKSSVTRMVAALLAAHGLRAGAYTSPHLLEYTERIELGGTSVSPGAFADAVEAALDACDRIEAAQAEALGLAEGDSDLQAAFTEFELLTAAALWLLRERKVEWAALEVGMGGRWDATSVAQPAVAAITGIALDHTSHLGETLQAIAEDKAHVVKVGSTAVFGPGTASVDEILSAHAVESRSPIVRVREQGSAPEASTGALVTYAVAARPDSPVGATSLRVDGVHGSYGLVLAAPAYQAPNAAVAVAIAEAVLGRELDVFASAMALRSLPFPGRFQVLVDSPYVIADGAHNPEAAEVLARALDDAFGQKAPTAVLGVLDDKDTEGIVLALRASVASFVVTASRSARALPAEALAEVVHRVTGVMPPVAGSVGEAIETARGIGDVVVTGSLTTAGEALQWAKGRS